MLNFIFFIFKDFYIRKNRFIFSIDNGTLLSCFVSMFTHSDKTHLLCNMFSLILNSSAMKKSKSSIISNEFFFAMFYLTAGIFAFYSTIIKYQLLEGEWNITRNTYSDKYFCDHFMCGLINTPISLLRGQMFDYINSNTKQALYQFKTAIRVGASGCIYGLNGIILVEEIFSPKTLFGIFMLFYNIGDILLEFNKLPIGLAKLNIESDGIDHTAHIGGLLYGILVGCIILKIKK
jgi:membrane associated rhomboid family serine protease